MFKYFIIVFLLLVGSQSFAKDCLQLENHKIFQDFFENYNLYQPQLIQSKQDNPVYDKGKAFRLDLTVQDLIDRLKWEFEKNSQGSTWQDILFELKSPPLHNFNQFYSRLCHHVEEDHVFLSQLREMSFVFYNDDGSAAPLRIKLFKPALALRYKANHAIAYYNKLIQDPFSHEIVSLLLNKIVENYDATHFTAILVEKWKIKHIKKMVQLIRSRLFKNYVELESYDQKKFNFNRHFKLKLKRRRSNFFKLGTYRRDRHNGKIRQTAHTFNILQALSLRQKVTEALYQQDHYLQELPATIINGVKLKFLSPTYIYHNLNKVLQTIKTFQFIEYVGKENDEYLQMLRLWVKKNKALVQEKTGWVFRKKLPRRLDLLENSQKLLQAFPTQPWLRSMTILDKKGKKRNVDQSRTLDFLHRSYQSIKPLFTPESLASTAAMIVTASTTGNLLAASVVKSLVHESIRAKRYDKKFWQEMKTRGKSSLIGSVTLAAGFIPGRFAHVLVSGAVSGGLQAKFTGRPFEHGLLVGAASGIVFFVLPQSFSNLTMKGFDKDLQNALIEYGQNGVIKGVRGFAIASLDDGDGIQGFKEGVLYSLADTSMNLIIHGVRYDPTTTITQADVDHFLKVEHNPVLRDRVYGGKDLALNMKDFRYVTFRKNSLIRQLDFIDAGGSYSVNGINSIAKRHLHTDTPIHELAHYHQEMFEGSFIYGAKYFWSIIKHGGSIYEDYFCPDCPF